MEGTASGRSVIEFGARIVPGRRSPLCRGRFFHSALQCSFSGRYSRIRWILDHSRWAGDLRVDGDHADDSQTQILSGRSVQSAGGAIRASILDLFLEPDANRDLGNISLSSLLRDHDFRDGSKRVHIPHAFGFGRAAERSRI